MSNALRLSVRLRLSAHLRLRLWAWGVDIAVSNGRPWGLEPHGGLSGNNGERRTRTAGALTPPGFKGPV